MNILYVYEYYAPHVGGGEIAVQHLAQGMSERGHTVSLVTLKLPGTLKQEMQHSVSVYRVRTPHLGARYWFLICALPQVWKRARQADVIHTFTYTAVWPAWVVSQLRRKKIVLTVHEYWGKLWLQFSGLPRISAWAHRLIERGLLALRMNQWIAVSHATERQLLNLNIPSSHLSVIYHGIDEHQFFPARPQEIQDVRKRYGVQDSTFVYLFFGRPGISKGLEYLLQAIPHISQQIPNSQAWLIIPPEPQAQYQRLLKLINALPSQQTVHLIPPVPREELRVYMSAAQAVVVPSVSEGFGFSVAETCAVGTPVVTTTAGSIPEVVSGAYVLVKPQSSEAIVHGLLQVAQGKIQRSPKKSFQWNTAITLHEKVYHQLTKIPKI